MREQAMPALGVTFHHLSFYFALGASLCAVAGFAITLRNERGQRIGLIVQQARVEMLGAFGTHRITVDTIAVLFNPFGGNRLWIELSGGGVVTTLRLDRAEDVPQLVERLQLPASRIYYESLFEHGGPREFVAGVALAGIGLVGVTAGSLIIAGPAFTAIILSAALLTALMITGHKILIVVARRPRLAAVAYTIICAAFGVIGGYMGGRDIELVQSRMLLYSVSFSSGLLSFMIVLIWRLRPRSSV